MLYVDAGERQTLTATRLGGIETSVLGSRSRGSAASAYYAVAHDTLGTVGRAQPCYDIMYMQNCTPQNAL